MAMGSAQWGLRPGFSQPTVSHHMEQLVDAGRVVREQRGRWAFYRLVEETLTALNGALRP